MRASHLEILYCPMCNFEDGASYFARLDRGDREPDFYDVELLRYYDDGSGEVETVKTYENLNQANADRIFNDLVARFPDAHHNVLE